MNQPSLTKCWDCANSTRSGCSWAENLTPVDGWVAQPTPKGFMVIECPLFKRDSLNFGQKRLEGTVKE